MMENKKPSIINEKDTEVFNQVAKIGDEFRTLAVKQAFSSTDWYSDHLNVLTGAYMYLSARHSAVKTLRVNNEVNKYIQLKTECETTGGKFVSASAEREARDAVSDFALAEHILESYLMAAEQGILTSKKQLDIAQSERQREVK
jgi:hypothetical protein